MIYQAVTITGRVFHWLLYCSSDPYRSRILYSSAPQVHMGLIMALYKSSLYLGWFQMDEFVECGITVNYTHYITNQHSTYLKIHQLQWSGYVQCMLSFVVLTNSWKEEWSGSGQIQYVYLAYDGKTT